MQEAQGKTLPLVLIVEDDDTLRHVLVAGMRSFCQLTAVGDSTAAMACLRAQVPDLVLLDIMLPPPMDGFALLQEIRRDDAFKNLQVIIISGMNDSDTVTQGLELGACDYMIKPFKLQDLFLKVKTHLAIRRGILQEAELAHRNLVTHPGIPESEVDAAFRQQFEAIADKAATESISMEEIARQMSMSVSTLERWVRKLYQTPPKKYILSRKMLKSEALLREQKGNIKEIAYRMGFSSLPYFSLCFKNSFGVSPTTYLKKLKREKRSNE